MENKTELQPPKTFRELCDGKMWKALEAMLEGLKEQSERKDFIIDMTTYGYTSSIARVCFGCAATCTVQKLAGINFTPDMYISNADAKMQILHVYEQDIINFEVAINSLRNTFVAELFTYFDLDIYEPQYVEVLNLEKELETLETDSWEFNLSPYYDLLKYLKERDI